MIELQPSEVARYRKMRRDWVHSVVIDPSTGRPRTGPVTLAHPETDL